MKRETIKQKQEKYFILNTYNLLPDDCYIKKWYGKFYRVMTNDHLPIENIPTSTLNLLIINNLIIKNKNIYVKNIQEITIEKIVLKQKTIKL